MTLRKLRHPIRRKSRLAGHCEAGFWRPFNKALRGKFLLMLERFELANRKAGRRYGPIGQIAIEVMRLLTRTIDYKTGRLDMAISTMCAKLKRCRAAVVDALAALRNAGFLDWIRRYDVRDDAGKKGPQIRQVSNAYRIIYPAAQEPAPPPGDFYAALRAIRRAAQGDRRLNTPAAKAQLDLLEAAIRAELPPENT